MTELTTRLAKSVGSSPQFSIFLPKCVDFFGTEENLDSSEASPTIGHANANFFCVFDRIRNEFLKK